MYVYLNSPNLLSSASLHLKRLQLWKTSSK